MNQHLTKHHSKAQSQTATRRISTTALCPLILCILLPWFYSQPTLAIDCEWEAATKKIFGDARRKKGKRPEYREGRLRDENLNDIEVRQIVKVIKNVAPQTLVSILGVTDGCACEDGPDCSNQVWVFASDELNSVNIVLSKIEGEWVIGPQQAWAFDLDKLEAERSILISSLETLTLDDLESVRIINERLNVIDELELLLHVRFPFCKSECD